MGAAIAAILPEAVAVAISPIPIIAVVLLLSSPRGKAKAFAFLVGWLIGLSLVGAIVLLVADPASGSADDGPADWVGWLILALGALAMLLGVKQWRGRPRRDEEPPMPKWMSAIDGFTSGRSLVIGFVLAALNPKNLALTLAAAAAIAATGLSGSDSYVVLGVFVVIGTLGLAIPIAIALLGGDKASETLTELNHWLALHNAAIMSVLLVVIGSKLVGNGLQAILV